MTSQPSRPNRFSEDHFLARKSSNLFGEKGKGRKGSLGFLGAFHKLWELNAQDKKPPPSCTVQVPH